LADKPAHILEIPDSLGRDVDRAKAGTLKGALPAEAFLSDGALEQIEQAQRPDPTVRQGDLVPITAAEAAARTTFDGQSLPKLPQLRRVIPEPFRRDRVNLTRHGRAWQSCRADEVAVGDMVPDLGRVTGASQRIRYETVAGIPDVATGMTVVLTGAGGNELVLQPGDSVRAFRPAT
jgi:hypothetical protein